MIVLVGANLCIAHPIMWERVLPQPAPTRRSSSSIRARPRRRWRRRSTCALRPKSRSRRCFYGLAQPADRARLDRPRVHRRAHHRVRRVRARTSRRSRSSASPRRPGLPPSELEQLARAHPRRQARLVLVDDGRQPEPRGRAHRAGDHQPRADDRQHRPARHRRQLDHRPVQRDGLAAVQQHHEPARRPRLHATPSTAPRSPASSASTPSRIPTREQPGLRPDHRGHPGGQDPRAVGHRDQLGALVDQPGRRRASILGRLDFLVVQDMYATTETAQRAHLVLPAAGWGEKEGTFINSERRIGLVKKVARAPGQALADFYIFKLVADAWGCGEMFARWTIARGGVPDPEGAVARPAVRHHRHRRLRACSTLRRHPVAAPARAVERVDARAASAGCSRTDASFTPTAGALHLRGAARRCPSRPTRRYPFMLLTGRGSSSQWHTQTRTGKSAVLRKLYPREVYVEISPVDARAARHRARTRSVVGRVAPRHDARRARSSRTPCSPGRSSCRCTTSGQPADLRRVRSVLAPAVVQGVRRGAPATRQRELKE